LTAARGWGTARKVFCPYILLTVIDSQRNQLIEVTHVTVFRFFPQRHNTIRQPSQVTKHRRKDSRLSIKISENYTRILLDQLTIVGLRLLHRRVIKLTPGAGCELLHYLLVTPGLKISAPEQGHTVASISKHICLLCAY